MTERRFRFGVVAATARDADEWCGLARRAEELGYATFLTPDTLDTLPPLLALSAAAAATSTIRLGTFVLSVANRPPQQVAWEVGGLGLLSAGRFELGLGAGRPDAERDAARLGVPFGTADQRIRRLEEVVRQVRARPGLTPGPRVLIAASGPRMLGVAARHAETVALGLPASTTEDGLAAPVHLLREAAGEGFDRLELSAGLHVVGDEVPPWLAERMGPDVPADSIAVLRGSPRQMADRLLRRRDAHQISYVTVNAMYADRLAPVVELLAGR
ncbi:N5,N10-methylene tetrahydromethanopterin reductase [Sphaerisporangium melleum]|uniref:N5,N10-methylene tetrahydromethanopterin reductase n=1 Tax=Sphaerisporangium melleum TaxID=321316 RepID=A0A917VMP9_9ACTN|nr:LLM class flavin-dependent oxidoreductase [Sphaerisporangium melleum]GGK99632.1 N5,N10-methylene tetrahydromethanopterin reductase [Sphaerisporangium melleum]GII73619.1 N5,N10-methylene tetrahydromethanopterin reductase [Sphaerisporangium melleum]